MAVSIADADAYINLNCVWVEDWEDAADPQKQRILNVAARTLTTAYPDYTIPDNAAYEFANVLVQMWDDVNRWARQGVNQFSVSGVAQFGFKDEFVTMPDVDLSKYIPQSALDLIGAENGVTIRKGGWKWTTL